MNAIVRGAQPRHSSFPVRQVARVDGDACVVGVAPVWPIADVLDYEQQLDGVITCAVSDDGRGVSPELIADLLDSRMIAPPRQGRRRLRTVSSRAVYFTRSEPSVASLR